MVMQNLVIVHGRPTWSSQFLISTVNTCGRFSALRYEFFGEKDIAFMTGQRPADVFDAKWADIKDGALVFVQNKTGQIVRIQVTGELEKVIKRIKSRDIIGKTIISGENGQKVTYDKFKADFRKARLKAKDYAEANGIEFQWFQFKDLRAKAATDSETHSDAQKLLRHKDSKTTAIYRRDKNDAVLPLNENNLFSLKKKVL